MIGMHLMGEGDAGVDVEQRLDRFFQHLEHLAQDTADGLTIVEEQRDEVQQILAQYERLREGAEKLMELERQRQSIWWLRLAQHVENSRAGRWSVCGGALAMGSVPFVFLAYVAKFVSF